MKTGTILVLILCGQLAGIRAQEARPKPTPPSKPAPKATPAPVPPIVEGQGTEFRSITPPLPAGAYYATRNGARLSGIIVSPGDTSFSKMPTGRGASPTAAPQIPNARVIDPGLRFERR